MSYFCHQMTPIGVIFFAKQIWRDTLAISYKHKRDDKMDVPVIGYDLNGRLVFNHSKVLEDGLVKTINNPEVRYWLATNRHLSQFEDAGLEIAMSNSALSLLEQSYKNLAELADTTSVDEWGAFFKWYESLQG